MHRRIQVVPGLEAHQALAVQPEAGCDQVAASLETLKELREKKRVESEAAMGKMRHPAGEESAPAESRRKSPQRAVRHWFPPSAIAVLEGADLHGEGRVLCEPHRLDVEVRAQGKQGATVLGHETGAVCARSKAGGGLSEPSCVSVCLGSFSDPYASMPAEKPPCEFSRI